MKGGVKLWDILSDKLEMLRASNRLPEAIRVAEAALELAQRVFPANDSKIAASLETLGQLHGQTDNWTAAKPFLIRAHECIENADPVDQAALYRSARRLGFLYDNLGE